MIWFSIIDNAAGAAKYFTPDGKDYHVDGDHLYAFATGKGADRLGIDGFDLEQFKRMLYGFHPTESKKLTVGAKKATNRCGYEVIFDGPKDLSVLWAFGDTRIPGVMELAVRETLAVIEADAKARVRVGKADTDRVTGNFSAFGVLHPTGREENVKVDCHLHYHVLIPNATWDPVEKKMKALQLQAWDDRGKKIDRPHYVAFYHARLAHHMQQLGYELEKTKDAFRVVGISDAVRDEFSQRTQKVLAKTAEVEAMLQAETGDPTYRLSDRQRAKIAAIYREPKKPGRSMDSLTEHWESRVTPEQLFALRQLVSQADAPMVVEDRSAEALNYAVSHLTERRSIVDQREVMTEALRFDPTSVTPEGVARELSRPGLIRREQGERTVITTKGVLAEEKAVLDFAFGGRGRFIPLGAGRGARLGPESVTLHRADVHLAPESQESAQVQSDRITLSPSQQAACRHVLTSPDRLILVRGVAGAGKSTMLQAVMPHVRVPWVILAPSVTASRGELRESGFDQAETLAKFLGDKEMQDGVRNGLIVLDEAGMAGMKSVAQLVSVAKQQNARILLLGDRRQHKSPVRGDVLSLLEEKGVPVAEVAEIKRQSGEYRKAVEALAAGNVAKGFDRLDELGWVKEGGLVDDYFAALKDGKQVLVISPTHAAGDKLSAAIRDRMRADGKLGEDRQFKQLVPLHYTEAQLKEARKAPEPDVLLTRFGAYRQGILSLAPGDTIRTTASVKDNSGKRIDNGTMLTVTGTEDGIQVRTATGQNRALPENVGHIAHGYVSTSHASQGRTVDVVLVDMTSQNLPAVSASQLYVSASRGRQKAVLYVDDREATRKAIHKEDDRPHAVDLVRERAKKVRSRLRKHLSKLRESLSIARDAIMGKEVQLER